MKNISAEMTYASDGISFSGWVFYFTPDNNGKNFYFFISEPSYACSQFINQREISDVST